MQKPKILFTNADGFADNSDDALIVLSISKSEIESCSLANAITRLHVATDNAHNVRRYQNCLFLHVDGYDDDQRELFEVPEVRRYFKELVLVWPHWLWFMHRGGGGIRLLLSILCEIKVVRYPSGQIATQFVNDREVDAVLSDLFARGNELFNAYGIAHSDVVVSANSAMAELFKTV